MVASRMKVLAGLEVTAKSVERIAEAIGADIAAGEQREISKAVQLDLPVIVGEPLPILYVQMDGTGVPVVKETEGRKGRTDGQPAHTREASWDASSHRPQGTQKATPSAIRIRQPIPEPSKPPKTLANASIWKPGTVAGAAQQRRSFIGDGAEWIWNLADQHFPSALQIVDLYHARQHLWDLARKLHPNDLARQKAWIKVHQKRLLDKGKIEKLVLSLRSLESTHADVLEKIRTQADYFERNAERMRYPKFRRQHLFVGSGVIEAGCKTVIGARLKQSGMFWTVRGANSIIALRCCHLNGLFEDYWESRRAA